MGSPQESVAPKIRMFVNGKRGFEETSELRVPKKDEIAWIDIESPNQKIMDRLLTDFKLHPFAIDETLDDIIQVPSITAFEGFEFIILTRIHYVHKEKQVAPAESDVYLFKNCVITVHKYASKMSEYLRQKIKNNPALMKRGADYILYLYVDLITDALLMNIEQWDDQILNLEERVLKEKTKNLLGEITVLRRNLTAFRRNVNQQRELLSKLMRGESKYIQAKNQIYFRDVYDHSTRATFMLENAREVLASTFESYLSIVSNRMNQVMKQLTVISTIFLPLTFIVGVYGMNFEYMPELAHPLGYTAVWMVIIIITGSMLLYFKKKEWF